MTSDRFFVFARALFLLLLGSKLSATAVAAPATIDFNRDIRRILSENCFKCHGPDEAERKGGTKEHRLRLDTPDSYQAIVPGHPEKSEVVKRITTTDPDEHMPPEKSGKKLTAAEIALIEEWIKQGAKYSTHWAYTKPVRPSLPKIQNKSWAKNEIDYFIADRLQREKLKPSPEADRRALIRRVSLDLIGLPPTPEEVQGFLNDKNSGAFERLVDRLLAKEAFGEHWARQWLDEARYADSAGYADDPPRTIWAYRDYVIRSFNQNKPFDQFTIEQIAGDLLPDPTEEQIIATGFHRNTMTNNEGGTSDEEFRNVAVVDRVNTTMAVWMGTTMACAQCHSHKYDPIPQEDYFRFFAILNNTEDADRTDEAPVYTIWTKDQKARRKDLESQIASLEKIVTTPTPELTKSQKEWEKNFPLDVQWTAVNPTEVKAKSGAKVTISGNDIEVERKDKTDSYTLTIPATARVEAIRIETESGHADGNFVISHVNLRSGTNSILLRSAYADFSQDKFEAASILNNKDNKKGWAVSPEVKKSHALTVIPEKPIEAGELTLTIDQLHSTEYATLAKFRIATSSGARAEEFAKTPPNIVELLKEKSDSSDLTKYFLTIAPALKKDRDQLASLKKEYSDMKPVTTVPVLHELAGDKRRNTFMQLRGNYLNLGKQVSEGLPGAFSPLPDRNPNRFTLAKWLVSENNPLTARVTVNRLWESIFGIGIVRTTEDFGLQGEAPSHPELLDWLATEFVASHWDVKHILKLMVTSAAYRQSSRVTPELLAKDPDNRLLARGPRFRLSAETVRDQAMFVSGLLSPKMYGPPVKPPQPNMGLKAAFGSATDWETSPGEDKYRRAIYTTWRRSNPYPSMATFDAPNREVCTVRRERSNTPLQALVTLNDPVYVEASQALARRMDNAGKTPAEKIAAGFQLCDSRPPGKIELEKTLALYENTLGEYSRDLDAAKKMAGKSESANPAELASLTVIANVLLNLDETLMKR